MSPKVLLSFDVEEFDMPLEYQFAISPSQQMQLGKEGLDVITQLLQEQNIPTTLFTTANFAQHFPDAIRGLANQHEIASHTLFHSAFENVHLLQSKQILESISQQTVKGLRMPRMRKVEM
jgi:peptidoglycan/xylan/chitin deacetylase (PgdA/CDA1 family)